MPSSRVLLGSAFAVLVAAGAAATLVGTGSKGGPKPAIDTSFLESVAVGGFDPVAYFSEGKPVAGRADLTLQHAGVGWRFSSEANRAAFAADPARYAPQYGGYCAYAVSHGSVAEGDPEAWRIVGGKLYLNATLKVRRKWERDVPGNIAKGDTNWPGVLSKG